jgi:hypothetical protein
MLISEFVAAHMGHSKSPGAFADDNVTSDAMGRRPPPQYIFSALAHDVPP